LGTRYCDHARLRCLRMLLLLTMAGVAGCTAHARLPATVGSPEPRSVVLGIAGAREPETALVVPPKWRAAPYYWDRVPADDTPLQVLRPCNYYTILRVAPVTAHRWWCWNQNQLELIAFAEAPTFEAVAANHPDWIWIIGNEPDVAGQDDMSPAAYAEFFGHVAMALTKALRARDPQAVPRLVFCQVSSPARRRRCEQAYFVLKRLIAQGRWPDWPSDLSAADVIHAVSVHGYARTDRECGPQASLCFGARLEESRLEETMAAWRHGLDEFVRWVKSVDGGVLAAKPLWLTEFGALAAFCPRALEVRSGSDPKGGVGCPDMAKRDNGRVQDDPVFYGRNDREGIWGVQRIALRYFLNPDGEPNANRGDWAAAWWFGGHLAWYGGGECLMTVWLFGHDVDCGRSKHRVSRAGRTFGDTIQCLTRGRRCPLSYSDDYVAPQSP
jgi:hypothetical protein